MQQDQALRLLSNARVGVLATVRPGGDPHAVPVVFAVEEGHIFTAVDDKPKTTKRLQRVVNIEANPQVTVLTHNYDEEWERLWWVRVDGRAAVAETGPVSERGRQALSHKYEQYRSQPPPGPVIVIAIDRVAHWAASAGSAPVTGVE